MNKLIKEARELKQKYDSKSLPVAYFVGGAKRVIPELCDALEKAERELKKSGGEKMKIYNLPRATGKTMRMLYLSEAHNIPILCANYMSQQHILEMAEKLKININKVITVGELKSLRGMKLFDNGVLIDEGLLVLRSLLSDYGIIDIKAITLSCDE